MHDIKAIRDNPEAFEAAWSAKGRSGAAAEAVKLDAQLRAATTALQEGQAKRNESSKLIGQAKACPTSPRPRSPRARTRRATSRSAAGATPPSCRPAA
jgi:seryl-tRNA synthetase